MLRLLLILATATLLGCAAPATVAPLPAVAPSTAVGTTRLLRGTPESPVYLMVQEGAYYILNKALDEDDTKTLGWIMSTYDMVKVTTVASARILKSDGKNIHLEVMDGPQSGRRGWLNKIWLSQ